MQFKLEPPRWEHDKLEADRARAVEEFRRTHMQVAREQYERVFRDAVIAFRMLLSLTGDLTDSKWPAVKILTDPRLLKAFCSLAGPPISFEELKAIADARSVSRAVLAADPRLGDRLVMTIKMVLIAGVFPGLTRVARQPSRSAGQPLSHLLLSSQLTK